MHNEATCRFDSFCSWDGARLACVDDKNGGKPCASARNLKVVRGGRIQSTDNLQVVSHAHGFFYLGPKHRYHATRATTHCVGRSPAAVVAHRARRSVARSRSRFRRGERACARSSSSLRRGYAVLHLDSRARAIHQVCSRHIHERVFVEHVQDDPATMFYHWFRYFKVRFVSFVNVTETPRVHS